MAINYTGGLNFTGSAKGDTNWDATEDIVKTKISGHGHTGSGDGKQIDTSSLADNAVSGAKIRLADNVALRSRNFAGNADVDLIKLDTANLVALPNQTRFGMTPQSITSTGASWTVANNLIELSNAGAATATINVPTAAQVGQPVFVTNIGAGTWTVTLTGQNASFDVATIVTKGSMVLIPIGSTTWAVIPGGGCTLA